MNLKEETTLILREAAELYRQGQCRYLPGRIWHNRRDQEKDNLKLNNQEALKSMREQPPEAACIMGSIFLAAGTYYSPAICAAEAAIIHAASRLWNLDPKYADIFQVGDTIIPEQNRKARKGAETEAARILKEAALLVEALPDDYENTQDGSRQLDLDLLRQHEELQPA